MKKFPKITIGYISHDKSVFDKHLGRSLQNLVGEYSLISTSSELPPANNYNYIIENSNTDLILLVHEDISFTPDLLQNIYRTLTYLDYNQIRFSSLGIVGHNYNKDYYSVNWSREDTVFRYETLDCCFILIDKRHGLKFDSNTFDDFHLYVEDYCISAQNKTGLGSYSILMNSYEGKLAPKNLNGVSNVMHHSNTLSKLGSAWGNYSKYKEILNKKHGRKIKTT